MNPKWLLAIAGLLDALEAIDSSKRSWEWPKWSPPEDWPRDERDELTRAIESWDVGTSVGDHNRKPFRYMAAAFLAQELRAAAAGNDQK